MEVRFVVKTKMSRKMMNAYQKASQEEWRKTLLWICALMFTVYTVFRWFENSGEGIFYTVISLLLWALALFNHRLLARRAFREYNHSSGELMYSFRDGDIQITNALASSNLQYNGFVKLLENKSYYFLYIQKRAGYILPKDQFTQGDPADFGAFIAGKTGLPIKRVRG